MAAIRIGAIFCPGTTMLTTQDIQYRLEASQAKIVITDEDNMWKIDEAVKTLGDRSSLSSTLKKIVVSPSHEVSNKNWLNYKNLVNNVKSNEISNFKDADMDSESISQIYFTSGTTGKPKMVAHSQVSYGIGHYKTQALFKLKPTDVHWCISDPGWAKSAYSNFYAPWITGSTVYIHQVQMTILKFVWKISPYNDFRWSDLKHKECWKFCTQNQLQVSVHRRQCTRVWFKYRMISFSNFIVFAIVLVAVKL